MVVGPQLAEPFVAETAEAQRGALRAVTEDAEVLHGPSPFDVRGRPPAMILWGATLSAAARPWSRRAAEPPGGPSLRGAGRERAGGRPPSRGTRAARPRGGGAPRSVRALQGDARQAPRQRAREPPGPPPE